MTAIYVLILLGCFLLLYSSHKNVVGLEKQLEGLKVKLKDTTSLKKKSEVRLGLIAENALPFLPKIPYDMKNCRFLGNPIDYVSFELHGEEPIIRLIEVKSGNAREVKNQKLVKEAILKGNVYYDLVRINELGVSIKTTQGEEL